MNGMCTSLLPGHGHNKTHLILGWRECNACYANYYYSSKLQVPPPPMRIIPYNACKSNNECPAINIKNGPWMENGICVQS